MILIHIACQEGMSSKIVMKQWSLCQIKFCRPSMGPSNTYLATKLIPACVSKYTTV